MPARWPPPDAAPPTTERDGIVIPLYSKHFHTALLFVWSFCALATDPDAVTVAFLLSDVEEEAVWRQTLATALTNLTVAGRACPLRWRASNWQDAAARRDGGNLTLHDACGQRVCDRRSPINQA